MAYDLPGFTMLQEKIRCVNGSKFLFKGLRDIKASKNIKSCEGLDIAWIEEADNVSEESWKILIPTIRKNTKKSGLLLIPN